MTKLHVIKDIDGNPLYEGYSKTRKLFLKVLVSKGMSFARADLRGYDLSHLDLSRLDFSGANLDEANMKGVLADHANFQGASMCGTNASAIHAQRADFTKVRMTRDNSSRRSPTVLHQAVLSYSKFDGSYISHAEFDNSAMSLTTFVGTHVGRSSFRHAVMKNVDLVESNLTSNNFDDAVIVPTLNVNASHLPDRTLNATVYGNSYNRAEIGEGYDQLIYDRRWSNISKHLMWAAPTALGGLALDYLTGGGMSLLHAAASYTGIIGSSAITKISSTAVVVGAGMLFKSKIEDKIKDMYGTAHAKLNLVLRKSIAETIKRGHNLKELCVLFSTTETRNLISKYTKNAGETFLKKLKATFDGELEIIICDRQNLSQALSKMCDAMVNRAPPDRKVVITRLEDRENNGPKTFILNPDGTTEAYWSHPVHGEAHVKWDKEGFRTDEGATVEQTTTVGTRNEAIMEFMNLTILDHGLTEFSFNPETHTIRVGRDKSSVVTRRSDGRIANRHQQPIILPVEGDPIYESDKFYDLSDVRETALIAEMEASRLLGGNDNKNQERNFAEDLEEAASFFGMKR